MCSRGADGAVVEGAHQAPGAARLSHQPARRALERPDNGTRPSLELGDRLCFRPLSALLHSLCARNRSQRLDLAFPGRKESGAGAGLSGMPVEAQCDRLRAPLATSC